MKHYYAFVYESGINTTYAHTPGKVAGRAWRFTDKSTRDAWVSAQYDYEVNSSEGRFALSKTVAELRSMGHADTDYYNDYDAQYDD